MKVYISSSQSISEMVGVGAIIKFLMIVEVPTAWIEVLLLSSLLLCRSIGTRLIKSSN